MKRYLLLAGVFTLLISDITLAQTSKVGTTTAPFLKLNQGARAAALGDAYSALVDDAEAVHWNPGAMARVHRRSAAFTHAAYVDDTFFDNAAYVENLGHGNALGLGVRYFSAGEIQALDATGRPAGSVKPHDLSVTLAYALRVGEFSLGVGWKYLRSTLQKTAAGGAYDFGVLSPAFWKDRVRLAATVSNLGGKLRYEEVKESLPTVWRLGGAVRLMGRWQASMDLGFPTDNAAFAAFGTEYDLISMNTSRLIARAGLNSKNFGDGEKGGLMSGGTLGLGFAYHRFRVDYGVVPMGELDLTHRMSFSVDF